MLAAPSARDIYYCHCEGVRSTLKTLSYDCGNPGQYVFRVYEVKRSADRINTRIRTGRNAPERHTHESRVNHPGTTCHPPSCSARHPPPKAVGIPVWRGPKAVGILVVVCRVLFHGAGLFEFIRAGGVCI